MARVPEDELDRLKAEVSLERLAEARGVKLQRRGADLVGCCPFHDDREPSFVISPGKNLWHCLGECQTGGSVVDFVMRAEGVSFRHAVELLRAGHLPAADGGRPLVRSTVPKLPAPVNADADDGELLRQVVEYYATTLREAPEAQRYLGERGLWQLDGLRHFQVGFANRTLGLRLPEKNRKAGEEVRSRLQRLGVLRESGHEHFNGSVVVPVITPGGEVVEMYGRKITAGLRPGTPLHMYLPGPHRGVWNEAGLGERVILCEALLDALTFWVHGNPSVTAAYGTEGFGDEHLEAFSRRGVTRVDIAYDRDAAGDRAAVRLATKLISAGIDVYRVQFPRDLDANAYACEELSTAAERLTDAVRRAVWLGKGARPETVGRPSPAATVRTDEDGETTGGAAATSAVSPAPAEAPSPSVAGPVATAASVSAPGAPAAELTVGDDEVTVRLGDRRWRVRGIARVSGDDALRVNVLLRTADDRFHVDTLDLYVSRQRLGFAKEAATETGILDETVRRDLGRVLLHLEQILADRRAQAQAAAGGRAELSPEEREAGLGLLRDPDLLERVVADYERVGVVGEATNKLVAYLAATSRLLEQPLAVVVQSSSAAGKSALLEATLTLLPDEARVKYSAMTGQSLYYMAEGELAHKVLAVVEEAGAERAAYALKLLQSEGELSIASTGKDPQTGRLVTHEYNVRGPVALFLTTTSVNVDEELLNRCLVLSVDEERDQTQAIHRRQRERETLQGLLGERDRRQVIARHRAAQTLLRPLLVVNPYAPRLTFADRRTRSRRDHQKYLTLIRTVALLHQYQREVRLVTAGGEAVEYIEVVPADIAVANRLVQEVLGRSLDELPTQTRRLLLLLDGLVCRLMAEGGLARDEVRLTRRGIREATGWGHSQIAVHLGRLCDLEYLIGSGTGRRGRTVEYELAWTGGAPEATVFDGLTDPASLMYDTGFPAHRGGLPEREAEFPGPFRPHSGLIPGGYRPIPGPVNPNGHKGLPSICAAEGENAVPGRGVNPVVPVAVVPVAAVR